MALQTRHLPYHIQYLTVLKFMDLRDAPAYGKSCSG